ncbi:hypothetical protein VFPFJ_06580 [Purpureocillium lilacinum]|uniref:Uncharacterized protein n=1 Tax=Purpureocillium lilacinum TaxID=33203 RepID=A0A179HCU2_PURLI|nr:hypothetical protein VFPFJ_06580 [Purpureocillium lilacinum]OAQ88115.1 hypothetical protein VFPFJ_06580 [Purpureocillium lilacinum]
MAERPEQSEEHSSPYPRARTKSALRTLPRPAAAEWTELGVSIEDSAAVSRPPPLEELRRRDPGGTRHGRTLQSMETTRSWAVAWGEGGRYAAGIARRSLDGREASLRLFRFWLLCPSGAGCISLAALRCDALHVSESRNNDRQAGKQTDKPEAEKGSTSRVPFLVPGLWSRTGGPGQGGGRGARRNARRGLSACLPGRRSAPQRAAGRAKQQDTSVRSRQGKPGQPRACALAPTEAVPIAGQKAECSAVQYMHFSAALPDLSKSPCRPASLTV